MMDRELLPCMTGAERESYASWLDRIAKGKRGSVADRLRQIAKEIRGEF
jgi:hypothetical protein